MKTLPGTLTLVVLAAIGSVVILTLHAFAQPKPTPDPNAPFTLSIKTVAALKDGGSNQSLENFRQTLKTYGKKGYKVTLIHDDGQHEELNGGSQNGTHSKLDIKTDKVTTSEIAKAASGGELTLIQVHVTQQISTSTAADMAKVLATLQQ